MDNSLSSFIEKAQTKAFNDAGAFFAFGKDQYEKSAKEGVKYVNMGGGLVCPSNNAEKLAADLKRAYEEGVKERLNVVGKEKIIEDELANHECWYTGNSSDVFELLKDYGATEEEVLKIYKSQAKFHD